MSINCPYKTDDSQCLVAMKLTVKPLKITVNDHICTACSKANPPQAENIITRTIATNNQLKLALGARLASNEGKGKSRGEHLRRKINEAVMRKDWLISWLKLFRSPQDAGIGDTANRLRQQKKKSPICIASDAHDAVNCLLKQCSCSRVDAVAKLNQQWPY